MANFGEIKSTNLLAEVKADTTLTADDKELIGQAITVILQAANRYIKDKNTKNYISLLLTLIQSLLVGAI